MTTSTDHAAAHGSLARRMFVAPARLGWEYDEPAGARPSPLRDQEPRWCDPAPPRLLELDARLRQARRWLPVAGLAAAVAGIALISLVSAPGSADATGMLMLPVCLVAAAAPVTQVVALQARRRQILDSAAAEAAADRRRYEQVRAEWSRAVAEHDAAERARLDRTDRWFPLVLPRGARRVDIVGGCGEGRAVLLMVLGTSMLAAGEQITLVDLTDEGVADPLAAMVRFGNGPVETLDLPAALDRLDLLAGIDRFEVADVLAPALCPPRPGEQPDRRDTVAELLTVVAKHLTAPLTLARMVAGLRVLDRTYDGRTDLLGPDEVTGLTAASHDAVTGERVRDELRMTITRLQLMDRSPRSGSTGRFAPLDGRGLSVASTSARGSERQKELLDRVLVGLLTRAARGPRTDAAPRAFVVAGADDLGRAPIEELVRVCERAGIRLVLLFDHLRDDAVALLGSRRAATVLMQLGNPQEAAAAATLIGKDHSFALTQVSRQQGTTRTVGGGDSTTAGSSETTTTGHSQGGSQQGLHGGSNWSMSESRASGTSFSHTRSSSWSLADSATDGTVVSRVYEFAVEPTTIQALPPTAFVLVDHGDGTRRVATGNCDPRITELPHLSVHPRGKGGGDAAV